MNFKEFEQKFEIAVLIGNYLRGDKLELLTASDKSARISDKIKRFKQKGLI